MTKVNWDINRKLIRISDLSDQQIEDATVVLSVAAKTRSFGGLFTSKRAKGLIKTAQFFADEQQRRLIKRLGR